MFAWFRKLFNASNTRGSSEVPEPIGYPPLPVGRDASGTDTGRVGTVAGGVPVVVPSLLPDGYLPPGAIAIDADVPPLAVGGVVEFKDSVPDLGLRGDWSPPFRMPPAPISVSPDGLEVHVTSVRLAPVNTGYLTDESWGSPPESIGDAP